VLFVPCCAAGDRSVSGLVNREALHRSKMATAAASLTSASPVRLEDNVGGGIRPLATSSGALGQQYLRTKDRTGDCARTPRAASSATTGMPLTTITEILTLVESRVPPT